MSMDYEKLKDLINHLDTSSLAYVDYKSDSEHVILSKEVPAQTQAAQATTEVAAAPAEAPAAPVATAEAEAAAVEEATGEVVESPMVGVVYLQPGPDKEPYVKVGDRVEKGDTVCIVEAMKLMNEIQAHTSGIVTEILVDNEEVVEYAQPLIRID